MSSAASPPVKWTEIASAIGSIATALALIGLGYQIYLSKEFNAQTNGYKARSDLLAAYSAANMADAAYQAAPGTLSLRSTAINQDLVLDSVFQNVDALHGNGGLSEATWQSLRQELCPTFGNTYVRDGVAMNGARAFCRNYEEAPR